MKLKVTAATFLVPLQHSLDLGPNYVFLPHERRSITARVLYHLHHVCRKCFYSCITRDLGFCLSAAVKGKKKDEFTPPQWTVSRYPSQIRMCLDESC